MDLSTDQMLVKLYLALPHSHFLGLRQTDTAGEIELPWADVFEGRKDKPTIHGGAITTLTDVVSAAAVARRLSEPETLVTLDMRLDYLGAAEQGKPIYAQAECYRLAGQVAFVRSHCYQEDEAQPFALGMATFMRTSLPNEQQDLLRQFVANLPVPIPVHTKGQKSSVDFALDEAASQEVQAIMPYAATIGLEYGTQQGQATCRLPYKPELIGNTFLPALHGGLIGGFMESVAAYYLYREAKLAQLPKMIDFSLDYLRSGKAQATFATCTLTRQGSRIANVAVEAWQNSQEKPIAIARCHFLLP